MAAAAPCASCQVCSDSFSLKKGSLIVYAKDVNMTQSRYPAPDCPFREWPRAEAFAAIFFRDQQLRLLIEHPSLVISLAEPLPPSRLLPGAAGL